jgi:hypothetical protein
MDGRFLQPAYTRAMPLDWFDRNAAELVSDSILQDVAAFWARSGEGRCPESRPSRSRPGPDMNPGASAFPLACDGVSERLE